MFLACYLELMENKKFFLFNTTFTAIVFLAIFTTPVFSFSENNSNKYSFRFENCTVNDALGEISEKSGIDIISNGTFKKDIFRKSYINKNLDSIIADLLRGENCAVVWNYIAGNLNSIKLFTVDDKDLKRTGNESNARNRTARDTNRRSFPENIDVDEIDAARNNYLRSRAMNNRNRTNRTFPTSHTSASKNASKEKNSNRNSAFSTSNSTNGTTSNVSGISSGYGNIRWSDNNQNIKSGEERKPPSYPELPESPETRNSNGLEPPPMPPGL